MSESSEDTLKCIRAFKFQAANKCSLIFQGMYYSPQGSVYAATGVIFNLISIVQEYPLSNQAVS